jgi:hypothetical protein
VIQLIETFLKKQKQFLIKKKLLNHFFDRKMILNLKNKAFSLFKHCVWFAPDFLRYAASCGQKIKSAKKGRQNLFPSR